MKRILFSLLTVLVFAGMSCGCGDNAQKEIDFDKLSGELLSSGAFTDILSEVPFSVAAGLYSAGEEEILECRLYCGTGATAEEIALFLAADEAAAQRLADSARARIDLQTASYSSYGPDEVPKLKDALLLREGNYVFLIVSNDTMAVSSILDDYA